MRVRTVPTTRSSPSVVRPLFCQKRLDALRIILGKPGVGLRST